MFTVRITASEFTLRVPRIQVTKLIYNIVILIVICIYFIQNYNCPTTSHCTHTVNVLIGIRLMSLNRAVFN